MFELLKKYCNKIIPLSEKELELIDQYFELEDKEKNDLLLSEGQVCNFVAFVAEGNIRHFQVRDGKEITCDQTGSNNWVTDFLSFTYKTPASISLEAVDNVKIFLVRKENLLKMYAQCSKYETIGRHIAGEVAERAIAMSMKK